MGHAQSRNFRYGYFLKCVTVNAAIFVMAGMGFAQAPPVVQSSTKQTPAKPSSAVPPAAAQPAVAQSPTTPLSQEMNKYPGLLVEFGHLVQKLQSNLQFPPGRTASRLLPLMPESTISYAAFSNYGDAIHQTLKIFHQELQESAVLRDWWEHGQLAASGPKLEDSLEKLAQLHEYLGEEIVVTGVTEGDQTKLLMVSEIRKPGLKQALQQWVTQVADQSKPAVRVLDLKELATSEDKTPAEQLLVLVRPDFVVAATDLATLRGFNARLAQGNHEFVSTPFGKRIAHEYAGGVTVLSATDVHKILKQVPLGSEQSQLSLQNSGFADMKYLIWDHTSVGGQKISQAELSFNAPRQGVASWLAGPAPLGSLDFVSPKAMMAGTVVLKNLSQIFDDAKELGGSANANSFAALGVGEKALKLSLKDDLLNHLGGEITVEMDGVAGTQPLWKAILQVDDAAHIQQTLTTLLTVAHFEVGHTDDAGVTCYTVQVPSGKTTTEIDYAFLDGYLIVGSNHGEVADAIRLHTAGESLGKSQKFLAAFPPSDSTDHSPTSSTGAALKASALLYENPSAMTALQLRQLRPGLAEPLAQLSKDVSPWVICLYGEESAIREASSNSGFDFGAVLVGAAVAIPNLLRSRTAANEASAVGSVRVVSTAQVTYAVTYPKLGFATELSKLGPDPHLGNAASPEHSGIVSETLAGATCGADGWCIKSGFRFHVTAMCKLHLCDQYVVVATPLDSNTGTRSFCSTSDGVVRSKTGAPLTSVIGVAECETWKPL